MHFRRNFLVKKLKLPETVSLFPGLAWCPILYFCFIHLCAWLGIKPPKFLVIIIELKNKQLRFVLFSLVKTLDMSHRNDKEFPPSGECKQENDKCF